MANLGLLAAAIDAGSDAVWLVAAEGLPLAVLTALSLAVVLALRLASAHEAPTTPGTTKPVYRAIDALAPTTAVEAAAPTNRARLWRTVGGVAAAVTVVILITFTWGHRP